MKKQIRSTNFQLTDKPKNYFFAFIFLIAAVLSGCHNMMYEKTLIVNEIKSGNDTYKWCYYLNAFPADQCFYSNEVYQVGDTVKYCR